MYACSVLVPRVTGELDLMQGGVTRVDPFVIVSHSPAVNTCKVIVSKLHHVAFRL